MVILLIPIIIGVSGLVSALVGVYRVRHRRRANHAVVVGPQDQLPRLIMRENTPSG